MNNVKWTLCVFLVCVFGYAHSQQAIVDSLQKRAAKMAAAKQDSTIIKPITTALDSLKKSAKEPYTIVPRKSTLFSIVPGGGQIYNRQYWKTPFVYAAFGVVIYLKKWNNERYHDFLDPYLSCFDNTGTKIKDKATVYIRTQDIERELTLQQITQGKDFYRRYRDLNWFLLAGVWALSAIEANVAAHLKTFDNSDDISLKIQPDAYTNGFAGSVVGVKAVLTFK
jgi:Family of unknown function (DUF5683)